MRDRSQERLTQTYIIGDHMTSGIGPAGAPAHPYATHLNILFPHLAKVDVPALVSAVEDQWFNQTLCQVNASVVRLGVMQGEDGANRFGPSPLAA